MLRIPLRFHNEFMRHSVVSVICKNSSEPISTLERVFSALI